MTGLDITYTTQEEYFNSHPHKEDDENRTDPVRKVNISTHILTRRMTKSTGAKDWRDVFQLTSSQGG